MLILCICSNRMVALLNSLWRWMLNPAYLMKTRITVSRTARFLDWNADGRTDIAFAIDDSLLLYLQTETGFCYRGSDYRAGIWV